MSNDTQLATEATTTTAKSSPFWKLAAVGFIAAVIGAECLVALIYLSSAGEASDHEAAPHAEAADEDHAHTKPASAETGHKPAADSHHAADHGHASDDPHGSPHGEQEVDLGQFSLTVFQPASSTTLLVDFHLYGTITAEGAHEFQELFEQHKHRIRDQIIVTIRSAEMGDLSDPGLGLIKRQILEKSNAALGERLLQAVVFSEFTFLEQ